jgi:uncharacterized protein YndB with AHSA1/START domain
MAGRVSVTASLAINRTPEAVFDYLADVSKHGEWSPKPMRVEGIEPGPVKAGDTFTSYGVIPGDKNHRNDVTVTEVTPPTRLVLESADKGATFVNTFELQAKGAGTMVTRTMDMPSPPFPVSLLFPLLKVSVIQPDVKKGLAKLRAKLEAF